MFSSITLFFRLTNLMHDSTVDEVNQQNFGNRRDERNARKFDLVEEERRITLCYRRSSPWIAKRDRITRRHIYFVPLAVSMRTILYSFLRGQLPTADVSKPTRVVDTSTRRIWKYRQIPSAISEMDFANVRSHRLPRLSRDSPARKRTTLVAFLSSYSWIDSCRWNWKFCRISSSVIPF